MATVIRQKTRPPPELRGSQQPLTVGTHQLNRVMEHITQDIDYVLCTHLHYDHIGWNTKLENGQWVPTFKNARYLFTRLDYEFLGSHTADPLYSEGYNDSILPIIAHGLADLVETTKIVQHEVGNGVWLTGAPGHSPGSCCVNARTDEVTLIFTFWC